MIKPLSYIFIVSLLFSFTLEARSLLYKVSSKASTLYILGSIHLAKPEFYPLDRPIEEAYQKSDVLVVEVDVENAEAVMVMQKAMMKLGVYPPSKSLKTELSPKTYSALQNYADKTGLQLSAMEQMRPWVVMLQLAMTEMIRLGYSPEFGIDKHFLERARVAKKSVLELETIQEQMALLSRDDKVYQDKLLRYTLASMHEIEPMLKQLSDSWRNGNAEAMEKIFLLSMQDDAELQDVYDDLITKRNHKMTEKIVNFMKTEKVYFVVVGAGHVIGKEGIVTLLKQKGYTVSQQ
ncbi:MAG: TraB/GumN family protein [Campylobacterota bacterium]|nr:TraB/GumN family protein [Campylobacterota bacterium]